MGSQRVRQDWETFTQKAWRWSCDTKRKEKRWLKAQTHSPKDSFTIKMSQQKPLGWASFGLYWNSLSFDGLCLSLFSFSFLTYVLLCLTHCVFGKESSVNWKYPSLPPIHITVSIFKVIALKSLPSTSISDCYCPIYIQLHIIQGLLEKWNKQINATHWAMPFSFWSPSMKWGVDATVTSSTGKETKFRTVSQVISCGAKNQTRVCVIPSPGGVLSSASRDARKASGIEVLWGPDESCLWRVWNHSSG